MNLGIALLAQQKWSKHARRWKRRRPSCPTSQHAWYNLGLVYKDASEPAKAIAAFQHVEKIAPEEPDAFYFEGHT